MKKQWVCVTLPVCTTIIVAGTWLARAGDLNPPAGPIAPTGKTLVQLEPRTDVNLLPGSASAARVIDQPGSYMLTGNIVDQAGKNGIEITVGHVTLDLNGFCLDGAGTGLNGLLAIGPLANIRIRNGTVKDWTLVGVNLESADGLRLDELCAVNNGDDGFRVGNDVDIEGFCADDNGRDGLNGKKGVRGRRGRAGRNGRNGVKAGRRFRLKRLIAMNNNNNGVEGEDNGDLEDVVADENMNHGVQVTDDCSGRNGSCNNNGINGLTSGNRVWFQNYTCSQNNNRGFSSGTGGTYRDCRADSALAGVGFEVGDHTQLKTCVASGAATEFLGGNNCTWYDCLAYDGGAGFIGGSGCTLVNCNSSNHIARAFEFQNAAVIRQCRSNGDNFFGNTNAAVSVGDHCSVSASHIYNSGAGGLSCGSNCRYENNFVSWDIPPIGPSPIAYGFGSHCTVRLNVSDGGGFFVNGVDTSGVGNVLDANVTMQCAVGFKTTNPDNIVTSCVSGGNAMINYDLAAGTKAGAITNDPSSPGNSYANIQCP